MDLFWSFKQLFYQKHTLKSLTIRNLKAKYVGSVMGITWIIITPLLMAGVISFIFTKVLKVHISNFPLFVLSGFLPWIFFSRSLAESTNSIIENVNLLNQFKFSREIIPLSVVLSNFISFILGFLVVLPLFLVFQYRIIIYIWLLPVVFLSFFFFTCGLSIFLSALNVLLKDTKHILDIGMLFWFWMTPIFYSIHMVPARYRIISYLNPLTFYVIIFRDLLYEAQFPKVSNFIIVIILGFIMQVLGYIFFKKTSSQFLKKL